jgi:hypothetical protein
MKEMRELRAYEPPKLLVVGQVADLTLGDIIDKKFGGSDGMTFLGIPITNASP